MELPTFTQTIILVQGVLILWNVIDIQSLRKRIDKLENTTK